MNTSSSLTMAEQPMLSRVALMTIAALVAVCLASAVFAAPKADRGGGGGGKGGGGTADTSTTSGYQPNVRLECRVALDGYYSQVRPEVAADGTIYVVDTSKVLYAFNPDCTLKWRVDDAGNKGLAIGPDGTVFTGTEDWIKAFNPDGSPKWTFTQDPRAFVLIDVAVGPAPRSHPGDHAVYGVASSGMGIFALDPETGVEIFRSPEPYGRVFVGYTELEFGYSPSGDGLVIWAANGHLRAFNADTEQTEFLLSGGLNPPKVSPLDGSLHFWNNAYGADGELMWTFIGADFEGYIGPALGSNGTHYMIGSFGDVYALGPNGGLMWSAPYESGASQIDVDPSDSILILNCGGPGAPECLQAMSASGGSTLWRMELPVPEGGEADSSLYQYVDTNVGFSASGDRAYIVTAVVGSSVSAGHGIFNVVSTDPRLPDASTLLRVTDISFSSRTRRGTLTVNGTVTVNDESGNPVSGAMASVEWVLPEYDAFGDPIIEAQSVETGGSGAASFSVSSSGGIYELRVTGVSKDPYRFDTRWSLLSGKTAAF